MSTWRNRLYLLASVVVLVAIILSFITATRFLVSVVNDSLAVDSAAVSEGVVKFDIEAWEVQRRRLNVDQPSSIEEIPTVPPPSLEVPGGV